MPGRFFIIVLDGVGIGEMPDAAQYGDSGSNTLVNLSRAVGGLRLPAMQRMGLGNIAGIDGVPPASTPIASWGRMKELSAGKDTITGHWEMMGLITDTPFPTYPDGFPRELIAEFERRIGRGTLWGKVASGTEILVRLGDEHVRTGRPIVYTSVDSVFQIAAHEDVIPPEELYRICGIAREMLAPPHNVCRVIARPFLGPPYERTHRRRDYPLDPHGRTVPDMLHERGIEVCGVGKVADMFKGRGFTRSRKTTANADGMRAIEELCDALKSGLVFANLVDFDTLYGHRNDTAGFHAALMEFDSWLVGFIETLRDEDALVITADHGLDPTTQSTDHSREYVPVLYHSNLPARPLGTRRGFWDLGASVLEYFKIAEPIEHKGRRAIPLSMPAGR